MKIIKTASGKNTIRISKKEWESIGKKAGWMQEEMEDMLGSDVEEYQDEFRKPTYPSAGELLSDYELSDILWGIKVFGEESIAGFSGVREDEVRDVLLSCEPYELGDIKSWLVKHRSKKVK